jgi:hypothetical protein
MKVRLVRRLEIAHFRINEVLKKELREHQREWYGGVAQVVECLSSKGEGLSSNPIPPKRKRERISKKM